MAGFDSGCGGWRDWRSDRATSAEITRVRYALLLLALTSTVASAQLEVVVSDSTGRGLGGARVELWSGAKLVMVRPTNLNGLAVFTAQEMPNATDVLVRSIGYSPRRVSLVDAGSRLAVRMERLAQSLPKVTIASVAQTCPQSDDAEARAFVLRVAGRYREPSLEGRVTTLDQRQGTVDAREVGFFYESELRTGSRTYTPAGVRGAHQQVARSGYAYELTESHTYDLFGGWQYPAVEAELAGHFATQEFADAHTFAVASRNASVTTIRYCGRERRRSGLDGTLQISERDGFVEARWRFWNPRDGAEDAGGAATFASVQADVQSAALTSTSGLFWRQLPSGKYVQRWQRFHEWRFYEDSGEGVRLEAPAGLCQPPVNYILCSAISVNVGGGSTMTSCNAMPYGCYEDD